MAGVLGVTALSAQTYEVKDTVCTTYAFSDPNPIPQPDNVYPYHKFETFAFEPTQQVYKLVVLENDWLRVKIFPEIGGKIWSIYDKTQGKEMFYDNDVVKFREISLRGPWTSGGIEFNYGVIGHAPSCAHPVDYKVETKEDGSVSCYIGVMELLTRTRWMVEINLPKDAVWVRTRSFWHNYSGDFQPYYTWANSGVKVTDDMELIYPGTYTIGHDGVTTPYPVDEEGRDLSIYAEQGFGLDKSFHPGGTHKGYFGAYWAGEDFGVLHYALRDEKLGRKYFSWAQSEQGNIWKDLLTDESPQYVELQSGRLFNQNLLESIYTPYKQTLFTPYGTDEWNEYWMPFSQIGNVDDMSLRAAVNVEEKEGEMSFGIYPYRDLAGQLTVLDAQGHVLLAKDVEMKASVAYSDKVAGKASQILLDGYRLWSEDAQDVDRPHKVNKDFSLQSAQGEMIHGRYLYGMRKYGLAEQRVDRALELDPVLVPALTLKSMLCLRKMEYQKAYEYANRALAVTEYDPEANYISGQAAMKLGKVYDAMDRFEIAAITTDLRSAAYTRLAQIHFNCGDKELAEDYARKSLIGNSYNVTAYRILYQICPSEDILSELDRLDPLSHFADAERMLAGKITAEQLAESIKEELDWQNYIEFAAFYYNLGLNCKAAKILDACQTDNALIALWKAYLADDKDAVAAAESQSIELVFPFREESAEVLAWAAANGGGWRTSYLYAMLSDFLGDKARAAELLADDTSDYAPYYAYRALLKGSKEDMQKASELDPDQWRYGQHLALMYYREGNHAKAAEISGAYYAKDKANFHLGDTYVKSLIALKQYKKADQVITKLQILPFEGQSGSHVMYRDIKLHLAAECIDAGKYKEAAKRVAESRMWPKNLGVGKPYDELIDNTLEDWLDAVICQRTGNTAKAVEYMKKVAARDAAGVWQKNFENVTKKTGGRYPAVASSISNMDSSFDKKLF